MVYILPKCTRYRWHTTPFTLHVPMYVRLSVVILIHNIMIVITETYTSTTVRLACGMSTCYNVHMICTLSVTSEKSSFLINMWNVHSTVMFTVKSSKPCSLTPDSENFRDDLVQMWYILLAFGCSDSSPKQKDSINKLVFVLGLNFSANEFLQMDDKKKVYTC